MLNPKLSPSPRTAQSPGTCVIRDSFFGTCLQVRVYQFAHDRPQGPLLGQPQAHFQDLPGHLQREPVQLVCAPPEPPGQTKAGCLGEGQVWMLPTCVSQGVQTCV